MRSALPLLLLAGMLARDAQAQHVAHQAVTIIVADRTALSATAEQTRMAWTLDGPSERVVPVTVSAGHGTRRITASIQTESEKNLAVDFGTSARAETSRSIVLDAMDRDLFIGSLRSLGESAELRYATEAPIRASGSGLVMLTVTD